MALYKFRIIIIIIIIINSQIWWRKICPHCRVL